MARRQAEPPAQLTSDWDSLADRLGAAPFLRAGWITAWWRAFGGDGLEILTARSGGRLEALLPVAHRHRTISSPSNWHTPQYGLLRTDLSAGRSVLDELFSRRSQQVSLAFLGSLESDLSELQAAAQAARYRTLVRTLERSPLVRVQTDWPAYERTLSGNLRRDLGRCRRRLGELGAVALDVQYDTARLGEAFTVERSGWKSDAGTAILSRAQTVRFYTDVANWAADRGWLRLTFLRVDDRAIAFHLAFEAGGAYFPLKGGFDPAFSGFSPGKLIIHATLERAFAIGLERYDFLGGFEDYKRRWATDTYDRILFQAFSSTPPGRIRGAAFSYGRPLAKRIQAELRRIRDGAPQRAEPKSAVD
jgi:CelD/BcsL family acetyltransferase involved in cellulose biosynthesis